MDNTLSFSDLGGDSQKLSQKSYSSCSSSLFKSDDNRTQFFKNLTYDNIKELTIIIFIGIISVIIIYFILKK